MMWVLMCFIALAVGFMMYSEVEPSIPKELGFLKGGAAHAPAVQKPPAGQLVVTGGWQVRGEGTALEISKKFASGPVVGEAVYESPVIAFMCDGKTLHARIDAVQKTTGVAEGLVVINGSSSKWAKAQGYNLLAPKANALLKQMTKDEGVQSIELSYVELGAQKMTLDTAGLSEAVAQFPKDCR